MKLIRSDGTVIEGTAEEVAQFEALTRFHTPIAKNDGEGANIAASQGASGFDWEFVSADVAFRALTRIKLGKETKAVIRRIYDGGDSWTSATSLQQEIGYTPSQFAGLMGAFGRRLVNTPGYVLHSSFFEQEWDETGSCYLYRLPRAVREGVVKARILD